MQVTWQLAEEGRVWTGLSCEILSPVLGLPTQSEFQSARYEVGSVGKQHVDNK